MGIGALPKKGLAKSLPHWSGEAVGSRTINPLRKVRSKGKKEGKRGENEGRKRKDKEKFCRQWVFLPVTGRKGDCASAEKRGATAEE